jgi:hypothetical protein
METATMDFDCTEFDRWEGGSENDAHLVVRETPPWKVRERWAQVRMRAKELSLLRELALAHITEQLDVDLDHPVPMLEKKETRLNETLDKLGVYWCCFFHRAPKYERGDQFSVCPTCKRKYAIPFADESKLPAGVYVPSAAFPTQGNRTLQALCRNGIQGES